jgi:1-acyl-sn-glycerol-3-phosphate acyltransferase
MKKIINPILVILAAVSCALVCFVSLPFYAINFKWGTHFQHAFGQCWVFFLGIKVTLKGVENIPPLGLGGVVAPNHQSMIDVPLMASIPHIHMKWVAKAEVKKIPFVGWALMAMRCYFVRRDRSGHDVNVMQGVEDGVKKGDYVLIFPEGTRTRTGELLPFKKGAFRTAQNTGKPLIPVAISGTFEIAKPGHWPEYGHAVTVHFGKPYIIPPDKNIRSVMEEYREILIKLLSDG